MASTGKSEMYNAFRRSPEGRDRERKRHRKNKEARNERCRKYYEAHKESILESRRTDNYRKRRNDKLRGSHGLKKSIRNYADYAEVHRVVVELEKLINQKENVI
jgi:hypothetical protein